MYFNCADETHPELQNAAVRKAIASAINREVIINAVLSGVAESEIVSPVSSSIFEYNAEIGTDTVFDPEAAKQMLADELPTIKICDKKISIFYNSDLNVQLRLDNWVQFYDFSWN